MNELRDLQLQSPQIQTLCIYVNHACKDRTKKKTRTLTSTQGEVSTSTKTVAIGKSRHIAGCHPESDFSYEEEFFFSYAKKIRDALMARNPTFHS